MFKQKKAISVFVRHCNYSSVSAHKKRFPFFSREACFDNLIQTMDSDLVELTLILDSFHSMEDPHFILKQDRFPVVETKAGSETASFLFLLDHVKNLKLPQDRIVYFLEDDYLHQPHWAPVLCEAFTLPDIDYVTLYDHRDKYFDPRYQGLTSKIYHTKSCHWRTTPSTTNTYAMRYSTLMRDFETHQEFSLGRKITADHQKFLKLQEKGRVLVSSIPGFSTHAEPEFASPCIDWELTKSLQFVQK